MRLLRQIPAAPALLLLAQIAVSAQTLEHQISLPAGASWCDDTAVLALFNNINQVRTTNNVKLLTLDRTGLKVAETRALQFSDYMATHPPGSVGFNPHEG